MTKFVLGALLRDCDTYYFYFDNRWLVTKNHLWTSPVVPRLTGGNMNHLSPSLLNFKQYGIIEAIKCCHNCFILSHLNRDSKTPFMCKVLKVQGKSHMKTCC